MNAGEKYRIITTQIEKNIYRIREIGDTDVDAYLVCGSERSVMIDGLCDSEGLYDLVRKLTDKPVFMLVTHGHCDHAGRGMREFMEAGCDVYISPADLYMLEEDYGTEAGKLHELKAGMRFDLGDTSLSVMAMPGHTRGSMLVFMEKEKIMFSSDAVGSGNFWMQLRESTSLADYLQEVHKLIASLSSYDSVKIYPGHSWQIVPYRDNKQDYLDLDYVKELEALTEQIIAGEKSGVKVEYPMEEELKGIDTYCVSGKCIREYCYDRKHVHEKE